MKKIEIIWRDVLERAQDDPVFEQKKLAEKFGLSTSTVFAALSPLRKIGAVAVSGRNFRVVNLEKILLFWATHRDLTKDMIYSTRVDAPVFEIEGLVDNESFFAGYSAARMWLGSAPADYDKVYVCSNNEDASRMRFPDKKGNHNLFVLKPDPFLSLYGKITPVSQTFVDIWNLPDWYGQEFLRELEEKFYGIL